MDFRVERKEGTIYVSGGLPDRDYQINLLYLLNANANDSLVVDQTTIAEKPDYEFWWDGKPSEILPDFLGGLEGNGYVHFMAYDFEASATFNKEEEYENIKKQFNHLPYEVIKNTDISYVEPIVSPASTKVNQEVTLKFPRLFVTEDDNENIVIRGTVNSEKTKNELIVAAKVAIPTGKTVNFTQKLTVSAATAPFDSLSSIKSLLSYHIKNSTRAEMAYTDDGLTIKGVLNNRDEKQALLKLAERATTEDLLLNAFLDEPTIGELDYEQDFADNLRLFPVYFDAESTKIKGDQEYKIRRVAIIIKDFEDKSLSLIVGGYVDSRGDVEKNKTLALKRANSVRDKLIEFGVAAHRLRAQHFGEDVSALSQDELWKVRRVGITLADER